MSANIESTIRRLACALALLALAALGGCPKEAPDYSAHPPAISAPLLREPNSDEEAQNVAELESLLRQRDIAILVRDGTFPAGYDTAFTVSGVDRYLGNYRGEFAAVTPDGAVTIYTWNADSTALVAKVQSTPPASLVPCIDQPHDAGWIRAGFAGWWSERYVLVNLRCEISSLRTLVFDIVESTWSDSPNGYPVSYTDSSGTYRWANGFVEAPDGERFPLPGASQLTSTYAYGVWMGVVNFRTGAPLVYGSWGGDSFLSSAGTGAPPEMQSATIRMSPTGRRASAFGNGVLRIFDLTAAEPVVLNEIELPANVTVGWSVDDRIMSASVIVDPPPMPPLSFGLPDPPTYLPALLDVETGRLFQLADERTFDIYPMIRTRTIPFAE